MSLPSSFVLDASSVIIVDGQAPFSIRRAARSVAEDVRNVGGFMPRIVAHLRKECPKDAASVIVVECEGASGIANEERFTVRRAEHQGKPAIIIRGGGELGAIHGLYHLAEKHLGIDPFQFWTGIKPARRTRLEFSDIDFTSEPHAFRFRGWHMEGLGVLRDWHGHPAHPGSGYWAANEMAYETLLRCRGNMVKPSDNVPSSPEVALAQNMGLYITQEHCCPFGLGMWNIRSDDPTFNYSYDDHPQVYHKAWERGLLSYQRPDRVVWTLGFRGRGDRPFWEALPQYDTDEKRGKLISRVLQDQHDIVMRYCGKFNPAFIHNGWMEGNRLLKNGHVTLPPGTITVWADNGYGTFRAMLSEGCEAHEICDVLPDKPAGGTHGTYYHVSMWDYNTPFLCQFVPMERIEKQYQRVFEKEATGYSLVNVGRVRHSALGCAAITDLWRHPRKWQQTGAGPAFLAAWCKQQYGALGREAVECYDAFHAAPFKHGEWGGWDDYAVGDVGYIRRASMMIEGAFHSTRRRLYEGGHKFLLNRPMPLAEQLEYLSGKARDAQPRWDAVLAKAQAISVKLQGEPKAFFDANMLAQTRINHALNHMLTNVIQAVQQLEAGETPAAIASMREADVCLDGYEKAIEMLNAGGWSGWATEKLKQHAVLPTGRYWTKLFIEMAEKLTTGRPQPF